MDFIEEAAKILSGPVEDDGWEEMKVPANATPHQYKFAKHPPAAPKDGSLYLCSRCHAVGMKLLGFYQGCGFWCVHCGPQQEMSYWDK